MNAPRFTRASALGYRPIDFDQLPGIGGGMSETARLRRAVARWRAIAVVLVIALAVAIA